MTEARCPSVATDLCSRCFRKNTHHGACCHPVLPGHFIFLGDFQDLGSTVEHALAEPDINPPHGAAACRRDLTACLHGVSDDDAGNAWWQGRASVAACSEARSTAPALADMSLVLLPSASTTRCTLQASQDAVTRS